MNTGIAKFRTLRGLGSILNQKMNMASNNIEMYKIEGIKNDTN